MNIGLCTLETILNGLQGGYSEDRLYAPEFSFYSPLYSSFYLVLGQEPHSGVPSEPGLSTHPQNKTEKVIMKSRKGNFNQYSHVGKAK